MIIAFIKYPLWIIIFFSFISFKVFDKKKNNHIQYFFYAFILNILMIYSVYLLDTNDYEFVLSVTLDRVMFQTSGFYLLVFIYILNKVKINNFKL